MSGYYPDGMSVGDIPGWDVEAISTALECDAPRLYVSANAVEAARVALRGIARKAAAEGRMLTGLEVVDTMDAALRGNYVRADEIDMETECGFSGEAEGERERGVAYVTCPICDHHHEIRED